MRFPLKWVRDVRALSAAAVLSFATNGFGAEAFRADIRAEPPAALNVAVPVGASVGVLTSPPLNSIDQAALAVPAVQTADGLPSERVEDGEKALSSASPVSAVAVSNPMSAPSLEAEAGSERVRRDLDAKFDGEEPLTGGAAFGVGPNYTPEAHAEVNAAIRSAFSASGSKEAIVHRFVKGVLKLPKSDDRKDKRKAGEAKVLQEAFAALAKDEIGSGTDIRRGGVGIVNWKDGLALLDRIVSVPAAGPALRYEAPDDFQVSHVGLGGKLHEHRENTIYLDSRLLDRDTPGFSMDILKGILVNDGIELPAKVEARKWKTKWTPELAREVMDKARVIAERFTSDLAQITSDFVLSRTDVKKTVTAAEVVGTEVVVKEKRPATKKTKTALPAKAASGAEKSSSLVRDHLWRFSGAGAKILVKGGRELYVKAAGESEWRLVAKGPVAGLADEAPSSVLVTDRVLTFSVGDQTWAISRSGLALQVRAQ